MLKPVPGKLPSLVHSRLKGIVSWWLFNESEGGIINDVIEKRNLKASNGVDLSNVWVNSPHGSSIQLRGDSTKDNFQVANGNYIPDKEITISWWQRADSAQEQMAIGWDETANSTSNRCIVNSPWSDSNLYWDFGDTSSARVSFDFSSFIGEYVHIVVTASSSKGEMAVYVNGKLQVSSSSVSPGINTSIATEELRIGSVGTDGSQSDQSFDGILEDFRIYGRALTKMEVQYLFEQPYIEFFANHLTFGPQIAKADLDISVTYPAPGLKPNLSNPRTPKYWFLMNEGEGYKINDVVRGRIASKDQ